VLDFASRYREVNNFRIYSMGRDEIKWGSEDHWTNTPHKTERICAAYTAKPGGAPAAAAPRPAAVVAAGGGGGAAVAWRNRATTKRSSRTAARTEHRDPRAFIMSAASPDFGDAGAVRQRADQVRRRRASGQRAVHRRGQAVSRRARWS
jgi:hypothetical protein